jgi:hypothetical protein
MSFAISRARLTSLPDMPQGSPERRRAILNLHNIQRVLAWFDLAPG